MIQSIILAFGHRARQGKDAAVAAIIAARSKDYNIKKYSFAKELKAEVTKNALASGGMQRLFDDGLRIPGAGFMSMDGKDFVSLPDWVQPESAPDFSDPDCPLGKERTFLQFWGEFRRASDPNYWIKKVAERIEEEKPEIALISDLRYMNEMQWCLEYGEAVKVVRSGVPSPNAHASETDLAHIVDADWGAVIYNEGTLEQLKQQAVYVFDEILEKIPGRKTQ